MALGFDPACEDLAELFIDDPPQRSRLLKAGYTQIELDAMRRRLAQRIQDAVEDWFAESDAEIELRESKPALSQGPPVQTAPTETPGAQPTQGTSDGNPDADR